jgi:hypothetical protein
MICGRIPLGITFAVGNELKPPHDKAQGHLSRRARESLAPSLASCRKCHAGRVLRKQRDFFSHRPYHLLVT